MLKRRRLTLASRQWGHLVSKTKMEMDCRACRKIPGTKLAILLRLSYLYSYQRKTKWNGPTAASPLR
jgi:hypothetical protein